MCFMALVVGKDRLLFSIPFTEGTNPVGFHVCVVLRLSSASVVYFSGLLLFVACDPSVDVYFI